jgi:hypothetical protein
MQELYFRDAVSVLTLVLILGMIVMAVLALKNGTKVTKWGRLIALFIVVGTAVSALSATRDAYATSQAVFAMDSLQSTVCSIAGGAIFLAGIVSIFLKKQPARRVCFTVAAALFAIQVLTVEASRLAWAL